MRQQTSLPTGTVTFLFTDIEGSTKLWEADAAAMRLALARHDELLRQAIEANGGFVFKTIGDAFCAAFATAPEAVAAALNAQQSLIAEPWEVEPPVRSRISLHTGAADERGGDYFGQPLNRVVRLLAAGHGGQTLISAAAQELVRDALPSGCSLSDLGDASLKDLARPERVYQLQHPDLLSEFPPLRTLKSADLPNNLPQQPTSFIGREKEIAEIKTLLLSSRLLTLVGAGGAGKTRLALQAAADLLDGDGDGVWLVELAALTNASLVPGEVVQALGIKEGASGEPVEKLLVDALRAKRLLIVLDNCEHVLAACAALAQDLMRNCPGVHLLATSREPLGAAGEQVYRVPSLSMPTGASAKNPPVTAESLSQYESVRLFIERAKAVQPAFAVTDQNAPAVAQVCTHLDGIPLAIELAAARVRSMPVEQVNTRLDNRFRLLTGGVRTNLPRQQTLQALIDWSYDLLTGQEKAMLARLSVFAGGWTLEAAESVCGGDYSGASIEDWEALDLLTSLSDKSLVVYEELLLEESGASPRYRLLETIRQYGHERLAASGETERQELRWRHACCFLLLAEQAEPELTGPQASAWLSRLERDHDNLLTALAWCEEDPAPEAPVTGLRLCSALWRLWNVRGYFSLGRQLLANALQRTESLEVSDAPDVLLARAKALIGAGNLAYYQGDYEISDFYHQAGLRTSRRLRNEKGIATSLLCLGNLADVQGDIAKARSLYQESVDIMRKIGDTAGIASSLINLGASAIDQGDYLTAQPLLQESLSLKQQLGDKGGSAYALQYLGYLSFTQGDYASAEAYHRKSLDLRRRLGDLRSIGIALDELGGALQAQGDNAAAELLFQESLQIYRQNGMRPAVAIALVSLGEITMERGDTAGARLLFEESLEISRQMGGLRAISLALLYLGNAANREGNHTEARAHLQECLQIWRDMEDQSQIGHTFAAFAELELSEGHLKRGVLLWSAATALMDRIGSPLQPAQKQLQEQSAAAARAALGEADFDAAWAEGQAITMEQAIKYMLPNS